MVGQEDAPRTLMSNFERIPEMRGFVLKQDSGIRSEPSRTLAERAGYLCRLADFLAITPSANLVDLSELSSRR